MKSYENNLIRRILPIFVIILLLSLMIIPISSQEIQPLDQTEIINDVEIIVFFGQGCPHCAALHEYLYDLQEDNPNLKVTELEVYSNNDNRDMFQKMTSAYGTKIEGVPTSFINDKTFAGINDNIKESIEEELTYCSTNICINPLDKINQGTTIQDAITIPAVIVAAIVDAINPCAFAVLIILLTTISATKSRKKALLAGLAFSLSIFISYFLMGLGLYSAIQATGFTRKFYFIVAILAIIIGLFNLKDYFWYGKWFVMEVPLKWRPRMKIILKSVTSPIGAFLIGFIISLFLLPCTSGPYIVILGLLANSTNREYAILLLLLYNLIFILPMLMITFGIYLGFTSTKKAEEWRTRRIKTLHLIAGTIILLLGIFMLFSILMGWI